MSYTFLFKYIIIGDSGILSFLLIKFQIGVGKSCLLLQYTDKRYREKHQVTIGVEFGAKLINIQENNIKLQIWDTAGQESFKAITRGYYRNAIGAIICYDVSNKQSFQHVARWFDEAKSNGSSTLNFILVGNKSDKTTDRKVTYEQGLRFAKQQNIPFLQTSAKTGSNVEQIFNVLTEIVLKKIENGSINVKGNPGIKMGNEPFKSDNKQLSTKNLNGTFDSDKIDLKKTKQSNENTIRCTTCRSK